MTATQQRLPIPRFDDLSDEEWRIDEHTRAVGRRGIAEARAALAEASRRAAEREAALRSARAAA